MNEAIRRAGSATLLILVAGACATNGVRPQVQEAEPPEAPASPRDTQQVTGTDEQARDWRLEYLRRILGNTGKIVGIPPSEPSEITRRSSDEAAVVEDEQREEGGDFLLAPIPFLNPTLGVGLALGAAYLVPLGKDSPPSTLGGGALYSENGSFGGAIIFKGYFDEDRYRVSAGLVAMRVQYDFTVLDGKEIPLRQEVVGLGAEVLVRVVERVFIGPQFVISGLDTELRRPQDGGEIPDEQLSADSLALGLRAQRDTRDSTFYPREGSLADLQMRVFDQAFGSSFDYQIVPIAYNAYFSPGERDVVALRASTRLAFGDVPFYGESFLGVGPDLRGYTVGTIHDRALLAVQAEYRRELFWRLGGVAFAGVGAVAPELGDILAADALPSAGFGLRVLLEKENHVNFRLDFAWGDGVSAIYFGVGEAF